MFGLATTVQHWQLPKAGSDTGSKLSLKLMGLGEQGEGEREGEGRTQAASLISAKVCEHTFLPRGPIRDLFGFLDVHMGGGY